MTVAVVAGALANKPANGGEAWVRPAWARGLQRLGMDAWLVEALDSRNAVDDEGRSVAVEDSVNLRFFRDVTRWFGLEERSLLLADGVPVGRERGAWDDVAASCGLLVNISGHLRPDARFDRIPVRVYVDLDPGYTQVWHERGLLGDALERHNAHYTVGANVGRAGCGVPTNGIRWCPIRQPVVLEDWAGGGPATTAAGLRLTTVAAWRGASGALEQAGVTLGTKAHEWREFRDLPARCPQHTFEAALHIHPADEADRAALSAAGWRLARPEEVAGSPAAYRRYVLGSDAEFSVAQGPYVALRTGWFSDRSARYLAAGKPVLLQDTGLGDTLPLGEGILAFGTPREAAAAADRLAADPAGHSAAARRLAAEHFDSDRVLGRLLEQLDVCP